MLGFRRWHMYATLAAILCISGVVWLTLAYFIPSPPSNITIAGSFKGGHYEALAHRYKELLARSHVAVDVRSTDGAVENLRLLQDQNSGVQIAFMQGGVSNGRQAPGLLSLGRIDYQVFWLFYPAGDMLTDLMQLKGKRVALGPPGSGTRAVSEKILNLAGITAENTTLLTLAAQGAVNALNDGKIDALFLTFAPQSPILHSLLKGPQYRIMNFADAEALTRIFPFLVRLVLPRGVIDYERKIPAADVALVATTNGVMVRDDIHPAIIDLLVQTMLQVHREPGLFQLVSDFPTQTDPEYPVAPSALDYYKNGPSFLNRYLPFWITNYVQRAIAVLLAVIAIVVPLFSYAPKAYKGLVGMRLNSMYRRLRLIEASLQKDLSGSDAAALETDLEGVDRAIHSLAVPVRYSDMFFSIKSHLDLVRTRLRARRTGSLGQSTEAA